MQVCVAMLTVLDALLSPEEAATLESLEVPGSSPKLDIMSKLPVQDSES